MEEPAENFFESLSNFSDIELLISEGESENQYLECKSPQVSRLDNQLKTTLAKIVSGFSNTGGGVIIWGVATTHHTHSNLDMLTQIEEIADIKKFKQQVDLAIISSAQPQVISFKSKIILKNHSDTRGILITYIPATKSDPVQSSIDGKFYIRVRDEFNEMPYETIKRMFASTAGPDLKILFDDRLVNSEKDGTWEIPIVLENTSSTVARDAEVSVTILNPKDCEAISAITFLDQSNVNPGIHIYMTEVKSLIFRGKNLVVGRLKVKMKKEKLSKRKLEITIEIFASNMRAKIYTINIQLTKSGFVLKKTKEDYLY